MLFSVIYSADCPRSESIARFRPPRARRLTVSGILSRKPVEETAEPQAHPFPLSLGKSANPLLDLDCHDAVAVTVAFNHVAKSLGEHSGRPRILGEGHERPALVAVPGHHPVASQGADQTARCRCARVHDRPPLQKDRRVPSTRLRRQVARRVQFAEATFMDSSEHLSGHYGRALGGTTVFPFRQDWERSASLPTVPCNMTLIGDEKFTGFLPRLLSGGLERGLPCRGRPP